MKTVWLTVLLVGTALAGNPQPKFIPAVPTDPGTGDLVGSPKAISFGTVNIPVPAAQINIPVFDAPNLPLPDLTGKFDNLLLSIGNVIGFLNNLKTAPELENGILDLGGLGALGALGALAAPFLFLAKLSFMKASFLNMFNLPLETASFILAVIAIAMLILYAVSTKGDMSALAYGYDEYRRRAASDEDIVASRRNRGGRSLVNESMLEKATQFVYNAIDTYSEMQR